MARNLFRKKCAKCNITAAEDKKLSFHRFPLPGKHGVSRIRAWAEYCYPNRVWSSKKSLSDLHFQHKMVCSKHFDDSCYTNNSRTRLNIFATPTGRQDLSKESMEPTLQEIDNAGSVPADKFQLDAKENNIELVNHCPLKLVKIIKIETNCSPLKQETEMDIGETSAVAFMSMTNMDTITDSKAKVSVKQTSVLCNIFEENPEVKRNRLTPKLTDKASHFNGPPRVHRSSTKDSYTSDSATEDNNYFEDENYEIDALPEEIQDVKRERESLEDNDLVYNDTPPPDLQPHLGHEDEFDYFGKNVAEQLRTLPLLVALETQEMLLSVLKKQRLKVLSNSVPLSST